MKVFLFFLASTLFSLSISAQSDPVFLGKVLDASTGEPLDAASIYIPQNHHVGTITNCDGEFVLNKCANYDSLAVSFLGYHTKKVCMAELPRAIRMKRSAINLSEVTVLPTDVIMKRVWEKYHKIYQKEKKNKNRQRYTFFYRQNHSVGFGVQ